MNTKRIKIVEWFLRIAISASFLSAVADRFGLWPKAISAWGKWGNFIVYTKQLVPFLPDVIVPFAGGAATFLEIVLGILLLVDFKTNVVAIISGALLLTFGFSMAIFSSVKAPLDYSVFTAAAACFALSEIVLARSKHRH
ncbi:DoxX family protein [Pseudochryseolinea flava]|uniref:DoxX family protein n=1 Tax=Pseudochryseolinea flava TaxID=2059302 RepID=A0A364XWY8_9BACT|nr:DoxX family protein [Pseudochryseolinea flava]RAV97929.1 DoxX family protein [Pseudochryseolinea flava]